MTNKKKTTNEVSVCVIFKCNALLTHRIEIAAKALWEAEYKPVMNRAGYSAEWDDQPRVIKIGNMRKARIVLQAYSNNNHGKIS